MFYILWPKNLKAYENLKKKVNMKVKYAISPAQENPPFIPLPST
jgi:hypothetical protein